MLTCFCEFRLSYVIAGLRLAVFSAVGYTFSLRYDYIVSIGVWTRMRIWLHFGHILRRFSVIVGFSLCIFCAVSTERRKFSLPSDYIVY